ncbi:MAG: hypothetical protein METHP_02059 [Methanoregula sp. SKADARSKE-2]|nr:MAG: hypothetical protein METHP_02059 [Methanoregula sp. SKADARSKE-2]
MRICDLILPEDRIFFSLFKEMAEQITLSSAALNEITHDLPNGVEKAHKVRQIEHHGDEITRRIYEELNESLITPLEPDEISRLAPVLDDVLDRLDWVTHQLANYGIPETNATLREYSYLITMAAGEIDHAVEINRLYNLSTELLSKAVVELFKNKDLLMIIKLKDIYEGMARVMEKCNVVGHALNDIAMAHS